MSNQGPISQIEPRKSQRKWNHGEKLDAGLPCPFRIEVAAIGGLKVGDPGVMWAGKNPLKDISSEHVEACEAIGRFAAIEWGFACCIIRSRNHSHRKKRNLKTGRLLHGEMEPADPHMTFYFGEDQDNCQIEGHIYVIQDENEMPLRIAQPNERKLLYDEPACSYEMWVCRGDGMTSTNRIPMSRRGNFNSTIRNSTIRHSAIRNSAIRNSAIRNSAIRNSVFHNSATRREPVPSIPRQGYAPSSNRFDGLNHWRRGMLDIIDE